MTESTDPFIVKSPLPAAEVKPVGVVPASTCDAPLGSVVHTVPAAVGQVLVVTAELTPDSVAETINLSCQLPGLPSISNILKVKFSTG